MDMGQFNHLIRAMAGILGGLKQGDKPEVIVAGMNSILPWLFNERGVSDAAKVWTERSGQLEDANGLKVALANARYPWFDRLMADTVGKSSTFERVFGYHARALDLTDWPLRGGAVPAGWRDRCMWIAPKDMGVNFKVVHPQDLAVSLIIRAIGYDIEAAAEILKVWPMDPEDLRKAVEPHNDWGYKLFLKHLTAEPDGSVEPGR